MPSRPRQRRPRQSSRQAGAPAAVEEVVTTSRAHTPTHTHTFTLTHRRSDLPRHCELDDLCLALREQVLLQLRLFLKHLQAPSLPHHSKRNTAEERSHTEGDDNGESNDVLVAEVAAVPRLA